MDYPLITKLRKYGNEPIALMKEARSQKSETRCQKLEARCQKLEDKYLGDISRYK
ncbi:hypothetical protein [Thermophagus xiamenensis]|uniref:hypothetical protein n=1 Tax=Thermophagus xiamenensis TaxID=385682 RepID=UPI000313242D|nr:hypothetical protein [Thermophagus xiamenensis]